MGINEQAWHKSESEHGFRANLSETTFRFSDMETNGKPSRPVSNSADALLRPSRPADRNNDASRGASPAEDVAARLRRLKANGLGIVYQFVLRADGTGAFTDIAEEVRDLLGLDPDALRADAAVLLTVVHPDDALALRDTALASGDSGTPWLFEWRCVHPVTGETRWIQGASCPERQPNGDTIWDGFFIDVTERRSAEEALRNSEEQFRFVADAMDDIVSLHDLSGTILYVSPSSRRLLGYEDTDTVGTSPYTRVHPDDQERVRAAFEHLSATGSPVNLLWRCRNRHGDYLWFETTGKVIRDAADTPRHILSISRDTTERMRFEEQMRWQAEHDALTALPNRTRFRHLLVSGIEAANRDRHDLALLYLDLDGFKQVNDSLGHHVGDDMLRLVARRFISTVPPGVTIARMGGDEFTVLIPTPGALGRSGRSLGDEAARLAERLLNAFAKPIPLHGHDLFVTASIGITVYPYDGDDADTLIRHADVAMYRAKEQGGNTYHRHDEAMNVASFDRLLLENSLRRAAYDRTGMEIHFQPRYSLRESRVTGCEALLRWFHPEFRRISPSRFVPLAEDTGLMRSIGEWVLRDACRQGGIWQAEGRPVRVSINLSARQLGQPGLVRLVRDALSDASLSPDHLELEINETGLIKNGDTAVSVLNELKALGIRLAVDNFGTGYSSLSALRRFPLDVVKIDRSFVAELPDDPRTQAVVRAIVDLGHALDLQVVAEGVETEAQRQWVADLGCDEYQGNLFSEPSPADTITDLLPAPIPHTAP
jgi:diguanylate cyclase (GGDEF)-like protein/PAS domain S-box-containing protein